MIIEILGVSDRNKGALLMLEAIRERLSAEFPSARFCVPISAPAEHRKRYDLLGVIGPEARLRNRLKSLRGRRWLRSEGLVAQSDVDVILDASGFGYGDFWGLEKLRGRLLTTLRGWKKPDKTAIMLPQALGPFEQPGMKDAFRRAIDLVDRAFARDKVSLRHVQATGCDMGKIARAPDFTNLLHPPLAEELRPFSGRCFVIPNEKMVATSGPERRATYVRFLASAVARIAASGREVDLLIHEGARDREIAEEVRASLGRQVTIVDVGSPLATKAVIASAELIVSSRFHGLVSALSNAVPSLACGWSHKYRELLDDYRVPDMIVDFEHEEEWDPKFEQLLSAADSPDTRAKLSKAAEQQREMSEDMWRRVIETIRAKSR